MSANVDLLRSIYANWERADFTKVGVGASGHRMGLCRWANARTVDSSGRGCGGFRQRATLCEEFGIQADEFIELDADSVLALVHFSGRGRIGGIAVGQLQSKTAAVFYLRDAKVTQYVVYWDRDRALTDLGLKE